MTLQQTCLRVTITLTTGGVFVRDYSIGAQVQLADQVQRRAIYDVATAEAIAELRGNGLDQAADHGPSVSLVGCLAAASHRRLDLPVPR